LNLRNCKRCKNLFVSVGQLICPACVDEEEKQFELVKQYLDEYPKSTPSQISEGTGVPEEMIIEFIKRGRLVTVKTAVAYSCELCRRPISTGRLCNNCKRRLEVQLRSSVERIKKQEREEEIKDFASKFIADLRRRRG
jgi:flagellar operon protein (TIGR03826 family)